MTTKRKKLLLEKRNRLKPIDESQLKGLHILNKEEEDDKVSPLDLVSPTRPAFQPAEVHSASAAHMPKIKTPFEMPTIDSQRQRFKITNMMDVDVSGSNFKPAKGLIGPGLYGKVPRTMSFAPG